MTDCEIKKAAYERGYADGYKQAINDKTSVNSNVTRFNSSLTRFNSSLTRNFEATSKKLRSKESDGMSSEEAIRIIERIADEDGYTADAYDSLTMAIEALEKADKYRWHDIRKNPSDLPKIDKDVLVRVIGDVTDTFSRQTVAWRSVCGEHWENDVAIIDGIVMAWREIEPFEVEE